MGHDQPSGVCSEIRRVIPSGHGPAAHPTGMEIASSADPSPGPLRLVKAPAAGHPLPQGGEGQAMFERVIMGLRPTRDNENQCRRPRESGDPRPVDSRLRGNDESGRDFQESEARDLALPAQDKLRQESRSERFGRSARFLVACGSSE